MSKDKLEVGDIWESDLYESIIIRVWGGETNNPVCCEVIDHNKKNGSFSTDETCLYDLKKYNEYKGKAKTFADKWYEVEL